MSFTYSPFCIRKSNKWGSWFTDNFVLPSAKVVVVHPVYCSLLRSCETPVSRCHRQPERWQRQWWRSRWSTARPVGQSWVARERKYPRTLWGEWRERKRKSMAVSISWAKLWWWVVDKIMVQSSLTKTFVHKSWQSMKVAKGRIYTFIWK